MMSKFEGTVFIDKKEFTNFVVEKTSFTFSYKHRLMLKLNLENGVTKILRCMERFPFVHGQKIMVSGMDEKNGLFVNKVLKTESFHLVGKKSELSRIIFFWQKIRTELGLNDFKTKLLLEQTDFESWDEKHTFDLEHSTLLGEIIEKPYYLMIIRGFGLQTVNTVADYLGIPKNDRDRIYYNLFHSETGSVVSRHLSLNILETAKELKIINDENELIDRILVEEQLSEELRKLYIVIPNNIPSLEKKTLNDLQFKALQKSFTHNFLILIGSAGTGKTYTIEKIIENHCRFGRTVLVTSIAHKALLKYRNRFSEEEEMSKVNIQVFAALRRNGKSYFDIVIVDEISMFGCEEFLSLLQKISFQHLIIVGDSKQLPSITWGNLFVDILDSITTESVIELTEQKRTKNLEMTKNISDCMYHKKHTSIPYLTKPITDINTSGIYKLELNPEKSSGCIGYVKFLYKELSNIYSISETFIITYRNETVDKINTLIHNDDKNKFCVGDKVKITSNNFEKNYYNNQFGIIAGESDTDYDVCTQEGVRLMVNKDHVKYGWAVTCHSFQGSEADAIIVYLDSPADKKWLYTALTRAKKVVVVLYHSLKNKSGDMFSSSLWNTVERKTRLRVFLNDSPKSEDE